MIISNRRALVETLAISIFFICLLGLLSWYGASKRSFASPPRVAAIKQPQEALSVWEQNHIRGRALYLFDRRINADPLPQESGEFSSSEFSGASGISALCNALASDGFLPGDQMMPCGIEELNSIIRDRRFYGRWRLAKSVQLPRKVSNLVRSVSHLRGAYSVLSPREKIIVTKLNRLLVEAAYPLLCPQKESYIAGKNNYMTAAVRRGFVRRIHHIIPDSAWPEVEKYLRNFPTVRSFQGVYRLTINEGVPVTIMRLRDIRPEKEPVLMQVDESHWTVEQMQSITSLLATKVLAADIVTVTAAASGTVDGLERAL